MKKFRLLLPLFLILSLLANGLASAQLHVAHHSLPAAAAASAPAHDGTRMLAMHGDCRESASLVHETAEGAHQNAPAHPADCCQAGSCQCAGSLMLSLALEPHLPQWQGQSAPGLPPAVRHLPGHSQRLLRPPIA